LLKGLILILSIVNVVPKQVAVGEYALSPVGVKIKEARIILTTLNLA
jgi:hypothetical protein